MRETRPAPDAAILESVPAAAKTFVDPAGRFSFDYSADFSRIEAQQPYYGLTQVAVALMSDQVSYHPMNYLQDSWFVVSRDAIGEAACFQPTADGQIAFRGTRTIDGVAFKIASSTDAGAGNRYESNLFRAYRDGTCYEIATTLHYASDFTGLDETAMTNSQDEARAALEQMVESFHFSN